MYRVKSPFFTPFLVTRFLERIFLFKTHFSGMNFFIAKRLQKSWLEPNRELALAKRGNGSSHLGHTLKGTKNILLLPSYFFPLTSSLLHLTSSNSGGGIINLKKFLFKLLFARNQVG